MIKYYLPPVTVLLLCVIESWQTFNITTPKGNFTRLSFK